MQAENESPEAAWQTLRSSKSLPRGCGKPCPARTIREWAPFQPTLPAKLPIWKQSRVRADPAGQDPASASQQQRSLSLSLLAITHLQGIVFQEDTISSPGVTALRDSQDQTSCLFSEEICRFGPPGRCGESLGGRPRPGPGFRRIAGPPAPTQFGAGPTRERSVPSENLGKRTVGWLALAKRRLRLSQERLDLECVHQTAPKANQRHYEQMQGKMESVLG